MYFATLERVKTLNKLKSGEHDSHLRQLITSVSKQIETFMSIKPEGKERAHLFDVHEVIDFFVKAFPLHSITSVINDFDRTFVNTIVPTSDFTFEPEIGLLTIDRFILIPGRRTLQVIYVVGFAFAIDYYITRQYTSPVVLYVNDIRRLVLNDHQ